MCKKGKDQKCIQMSNLPIFLSFLVAVAILLNLYRNTYLLSKKLHKKCSFVQELETLLLSSLQDKLRELNFIIHATHLPWELLQINYFDEQFSLYTVMQKNVIGMNQSRLC